MYTSMHARGLELTKLIYTRLEDNLIRHRSDRQDYPLVIQQLVGPLVFLLRLILLPRRALTT